MTTAMPVTCTMAEYASWRAAVMTAAAAIALAAWQTALIPAGGNSRRLRIIDRNTVIVTNKPAGPGK
jgi:predicted MFS family arabinose efflux permease